MGAREKGARPFQYKDHTAWPSLPANFKWVHIAHTNPSGRKYLVYYLVLCPTTHVTIYINKRVFFISVLLGPLQCTHLCIKIIKHTKVGVAPFAQCNGPLSPSYWAKGATLKANLFGPQLDVVKHKGTNPHDHKKWDFYFMTSPVHQSSLKKNDLDDWTKFHAA